MESKLKHLEFLQNVITRKNSNSFLIKGWTITIISALFALASKDANTNYVLVSYIAIPIFWVLDGFYLSQERKYRDLYNEVSKKSESEIDFSMDTTKFNSGSRTWINGILSNTLVIYYGFSIIITLIVMFLLQE